MQAITDALENLPVDCVAVHLHDVVPASALPSLLRQWGPTTGFEGDADEQTQRDLLALAPLIQRRKGTNWAKRKYFEIGGYPTIEILEGTAINPDLLYDGTYTYSGAYLYGFEYNWAQYAIVVPVSTTTLWTTKLAATLKQALKIDSAARECVFFRHQQRDTMNFTLTTNVTGTII